MSFLTFMAFLSFLMVMAMCLALSSKLLPFLIIPTILETIRFIGESLQEARVGPALVRYHLGDIGIIAGSMIWGVSAAIIFTLVRDRDRINELSNHPGTTLRPRFKLFGEMIALRIPTALFLTSLLVYGLAMMAEVRTAYFRTEAEVLAGYSGQFDWLDAAAYTIGMVAMILNYTLVAPRVRHNLLQPTSK